jgi:hypothetical protein
MGSLPDAFARYFFPCPVLRQYAVTSDLKVLLNITGSQASPVPNVTLLGLGYAPPPPFRVAGVGKGVRMRVAAGAPYPLVVVADGPCFACDPPPHHTTVCQVP